MKNIKSFLGLRSVVLIGLSVVLIGLAISFFWWSSSARAAVNPGGMIVGGASSASLLATSVCPPNGGTCSTTLTALVGMRVPFAVTLGQLYGFQATAPASGSSCAFALRRSAGCTAAYASTALSCTITGNGSARTCQNTTSTITAAAGDCLQVIFTESGTCSGLTNWGFEAY